MLCAIHQPQFVPWLGYFAKIDKSERFIFLDTVQYKKNEWQNRNRIKAGDGTLWLTIPVTYRYPQKIYEVKINNREKWKKKHLQSIRSCYGRSPEFKRIFPLIEEIYAYDSDSFRDFVVRQIKLITKFIGISTKLIEASELGVFRDSEMDATTYLIELCRAVDCDQYLSGEGGRNYLSEETFAESGIELIFQKYNHPVYLQMGKQFISHLSIIDLLFNNGEKSLEIIRSGN